jgi:hypothetical protein
MRAGRSGRRWKRGADGDGGRNGCDGCGRRAQDGGQHEWELRNRTRRHRFRRPASCLSLFPVLLGPRLAIGCRIFSGHQIPSHEIDVTVDILGLLVHFDPDVTPKYDSFVPRIALKSRPPCALNGLHAHIDLVA